MNYDMLNRGYNSYKSCAVIVMYIFLKIRDKTSGFIVADWPLRILIFREYAVNVNWELTERSWREYFNID